MQIFVTILTFAILAGLLAFGVWAALLSTATKAGPAVAASQPTVIKPEPAESAKPAKGKGKKQTKKQRSQG